MHPLKEDSYTKLAEAISEDFITSRIPLNTGVEKIARTFELNGDQIARLCEATNNITFHKLFNSREKTATDRIVEFDLADSKKVLGSFITKDAQTLGEAFLPEALELRELPDYRDTEEPEFSKTAFELRPESGKKTAAVSHRTLEKVLEHLRLEKLSAQMDYEDCRTRVCKSFSRLYDAEPFEELEKKAAALWNPDSFPVLADLRSVLNKPAVTYNINILTKTAGLVDDTTHQMSLIKLAIDAYAKIEQLTRALALVTSKL